jgi:hypothetical protein
MDQAIEGPRDHQLAQVARPSQACGKKIGVDRPPRLVVQETRGDQRMAIEEGGAECLAARRLQLDQRPGFQRLGGGVHGDLVGEYPGTALAQPLCTAWR